MADDSMSEEAIKHNDNSVEDTEKSLEKFRVYTKRWFVMLNLAFINFAIATIWLGFGPVAYKTAIYYDTNVTNINWLSMGFVLVTIATGFLWSWRLNKMGLRWSLLLSAWLTFIGAAVRACSAIEGIPDELQLTFLFIGQLLVAVVQPLAMCSAPLLAAVWFPPNQRSIATCISGMGNLVGVILAGFVSPLFVEENGNIQMRNMLITYAAITLACALLTCVVMTTNSPPTPPSYGSKKTTSENYLQGMKESLRNKHFLLLLTVVSSGMALYSTFATLIEQVLCPWGYDDTIAGVGGSVLTAGGLVGAIVASLIVDKTKRFKEAMKFMIVAAAIETIIFSVTFRIYMGYLIVLEMTFLGFLSFGLSPVGLETGAEITFPVGVPISSGIIQITGQFLSVLVILILQSIGRPMSPEELTLSKCHSFNPNFNSTENSSTQVITYDLTVSTYVMSGVLSVIAIVFVVLFNPTYKRIDAEKQEEEKIKNCCEDVNITTTATMDTADDSIQSQKCSLPA